MSKPSFVVTYVLPDGRADTDREICHVGDVFSPERERKILAIEALEIAPSDFAYVQEWVRRMLYPRMVPGARLEIKIRWPK